VTALHAATQLADPHVACAVNSNAINSTALGHGLSWLQPASQPTDTSRLAVGLHAGIFVKYVIFGNDDPFRHKSIKPSRCFAHGHMRLRAKLRHRTLQRFGGDRPRQNKQTRKYLVVYRYFSGLAFWAACFVPNVILSTAPVEKPCTCFAPHSALSQ